jgi:hypothetical protein
MNKWAGIKKTLVILGWFFLLAILAHLIYFFYLGLPYMKFHD